MYPGHYGHGLEGPGHVGQGYFPRRCLPDSPRQLHLAVPVPPVHLHRFQRLVPRPLPEWDDGAGGVFLLPWLPGDVDVGGLPGAETIEFLRLRGDDDLGPSGVPGDEVLAYSYLEPVGLDPVDPGHCQVPEFVDRQGDEQHGEEAQGVG